MKKNLPEKPTAILDSMGGQAALFDDPARLLGLADAELRQVASSLVREGGSIMAQIRRTSGLVAWAGWHRFGDKAYEEFVAGIAEGLGVGVQTVRAWRHAVVQREGLALPALPAARSAEASTRRKPAGQGGSVSTFITKTPPIPAASAESPRLAAHVTVAAVNANGTSPASAPTPIPARNPTGAPPSDRAQAAAVVLAMREVEPSDAGPALAREDAEFLRQWTARTLAAWKASQSAAPAPTGCPHPKARLRHAGYAIICDDCGTVVR